MRDIGEAVLAMQGHVGQLQYWTVAAFSWRAWVWRDLETLSVRHPQVAEHVKLMHGAESMAAALGAN